ncbi:MAG: haloacid dehalogenase-like hydrolase, partial [Verrucomicrobiae bacterium]|nr:haloacid dehalogenase-like hydrolase [Verrucomicrobiae bacterium]
VYKRQMQGLSVAQVVDATRQVYAMSEPLKLRRIVIRPGGPSWPVPFLYPEMVELMARMIRASFRIWIVSATNVWSVRWMVQHALNPALHELGASHGISPERVIGIATLLTDDRNHLFKDSILVKEDPAYAALDMDRLGKLRLTSKLQFPVPTYSGKVACIWDALRRRPHFAAGDSLGDSAMLLFARHRLWIARLDKPNIQRSMARVAQANNRKRWIVQPVWCGEPPGFLPDPIEVRDRFGWNCQAVRQSVAAWFSGD